MTKTQHKLQPVKLRFKNCATFRAGARHTLSSAVQPLPSVVAFFRPDFLRLWAEKPIRKDGCMTELMCLISAHPNTPRHARGGFYLTCSEGLKK